MVALLAVLVGVAMLVMAVLAVIWMIWKYCKWSADFHHMLRHMVESYDVRTELPEVGTYSRSGVKPSCVHSVDTFVYHTHIYVPFPESVSLLLVSQSSSSNGKLFNDMLSMCPNYLMTCSPCAQTI